MKITVLTPTYNRNYILSKLYNSLKGQNCKKFTWMIIDDGSSDETKELVKQFENENIVSIIYIYQKNGGKARALNNGFKYWEKTAAFMVVDSDDYLLPDAIEKLYMYLKKYKNYKNIGAFFFHYKTANGDLLGSTRKRIYEDQIITMYEYINRFPPRDGCICYLSSVVKKYSFPEYKNEKYVAPSFLQMKISSQYKIVFSPDIIGVSEYLPDGITQSGRQLRLKNPKSMLKYVYCMMDKHLKLFIRLKYAISIWPYAKKAKYSLIDIIRTIPYPLLALLGYLPGQMLSMYWDLKYPPEGKKERI